MQSLEEMRKELDVIDDQITTYVPELARASGEARTSCGGAGRPS